MFVIRKRFTIFTDPGDNEERYTNDDPATSIDHPILRRNPSYIARISTPQASSDSVSGSSFRSKDNCRSNPPPFTIEHRDLVCESWHYVEYKFRQVIKLSNYIHRMFPFRKSWFGNVLCTHIFNFYFR